MFRESAKELRRRAEEGDQNAGLIVVSMLVGLPLLLASRVPLQSPAVDEWSVAWDPDNGTILTDLDGAIIKGAAKPSPWAGNTLLPASSVVVRPQPQFAKAIIDSAIKRYPEARTLGEPLG